MISSGSNLAKWLALIPFGYQLITRISRQRDAAFLIASAWVPGIWIIHRAGDYEIIQSIGLYFLGYLAFVAIYELGYFWNDAWDARRSPKGRHRIRFNWSAGYVVLFIAVRLLAWAAIATLTGWLYEPLWLGAFAVVVAAFAQHNLIGAAALRSASFLQLAILRFVLPVLPSIPPDFILPVIAASFLFYVYFRFLSYLDSKDLLVMPERSRPGFQFIQMLMFAPLMIFLGFAADTTIFWEVLAYFVAIFGIWVALGARASQT